MVGFFFVCMSFSYDFTCETPHNQFTQFFIEFVVVHEWEDSWLQWTTTTLASNTKKKNWKRRKKTSSEAEKKSHHYQSIFNFQITFDAVRLLPKAHSISSWLDAHWSIYIADTFLSSVSSIPKFSYAIFLIFFRSIFFSSGSGFSGGIFCPVETKI